MSIDAKQTFVNTVKGILADRMTFTELTKTIDAVRDELSHYNMERCADNGTGMEFKEMMDAYLATKLTEGCSPATIERYRYVLSCFQKSVNIPIRDISVFTIRGYLSKERERGISDRTLEGYRQIFAVFFKWLHNEGLIPKNPCGNLAPIKYQKKVFLPYSDVDLEYIKENCKSTRDIAIVHFLLSSGCRISEMCALNRNDIDFSTLRFKVLGKGNKERIIYIDEVTAMYLQRYFKERKDDSVALFAGRGTKRMSPGGVRNMLKHVGISADVIKCHPHRFRRTLATNLILRGMDIQNVKEILGHENIDTTMAYVYIDSNTTQNEYRKYA